MRATYMDGDITIVLDPKTNELIWLREKTLETSLLLARDASDLGKKVTLAIEENSEPDGILFEYLPKERPRGFQDIQEARCRINWAAYNQLMERGMIGTRDGGHQINIHSVTRT